MYITIDNLVVLFCAGLTLLMIASQFLAPRRRRENLLFSSVLSCILVIQLQYVLAGTGWAYDVPSLFSVHHAVWYLLGPLTWLHYRNVIRAGNSRNRRALLVLLPALAVLAFELYSVVAATPDPARDFVRLGVEPAWGLRRALKIGGLVMLLGFFAEFFVFVFRTWAIREMPLVARWVLVTYIVPVVSILLILLAYVLGDASLEKAGFVLFALQMAGWYLIGYRLPEVLLLFRRELKRKYARSLIARLDAESLLARLRSIMEEERIYLDEGLTLANLAGRLGVTVHQLSELLNARLGTGFKGYVNAFRVDEARRLLEHDGGLTALAVGMSVGFNSKSAYYSAFSAATGMTPQEYRRRQEAGEGREKK